MNRGPDQQWLTSWAARMIALAGLIHLVIVPQHWAHAPAHGLFFGVAGVVEVVWGIAVWRRPSARLYQVGLVGAGSLVVLWSVTRLLPSPFGHGPEPIDSFGVACKLSEGLGVVILALLVFQIALAQAGRVAARRMVSLLVAAAFVTGFLVYGIGRAAEPVFPWLGAPLTENYEAAPGAEHEHDHELTPVPDEGREHDP